MRRGDKNTAPDQYRTTFEKLNNKWGLTFNDDRIIVPTELRKKQLDTLHFGHAGATKMTAEADYAERNQRQNKTLRGLHVIG